jgi:hypothetical protein
VLRSPQVRSVHMQSRPSWNPSLFLADNVLPLRASSTGGWDLVKIALNYSISIEPRPATVSAQQDLPQFARLATILSSGLLSCVLLCPHCLVSNFQMPRLGRNLTTRTVRYEVQQQQKLVLKRNDRELG